MTTPSEARGSSAWRLAQDESIELHDPARVREPSFAGRLKASRIDLLLNVHSLHIADPAVIAAPTIGSFNLHPGPLPDYRGLNAPSWAIYDGRENHAVTLHWMTADVDAGPIAYESRFELNPADTGLKVSARCVDLGLELVERLLEDAARDSIPARPQPDRPGVWHGREAPNQGWIDWRQPALRIAAQIRAADFHPLPSPWGSPKTKLGAVVFEVTAVEPTGEATESPPGQVRFKDGEAMVAAGDNWLILKRLRRDGRKVAAEQHLSPAARLG